MTANSKTATRKRADLYRSETAARKRAERDACTVWRSCLGCGLRFPSEGVHNRLCSRCRRSERYIGPFDEHNL